MSNPFPAHFATNCQSCGDDMLEGDQTFRHDGLFICATCATDAECVCKCGNYRMPRYEECYECYSGKGDISNA